jgi:hypothetical protein
MGGRDTCNTGDGSDASDIDCRPNSSVNEVTGSLVTRCWEEACAMCKLDVLSDAGNIEAVGGGRELTWLGAGEEPAEA